MKRMAVVTMAATVMMAMAGGAMAAQHTDLVAAQAKHGKHTKHAKHSKHAKSAKQHKHAAPAQQPPADAPAT